MCIRLLKGLTVEEIVARNSQEMTYSQKAEYWYELSQNLFSLLGKVNVQIVTLSQQDWISIVQAQYPTLTDIKIADSQFFTTTLEGIKSILQRDWSNLAPYVVDTGDCDKYAIRLYNHLCDYYRLNSIVPVWGDTDKGYHGFNLSVVLEGDRWIARLVEPQTDEIFVDQGPMGQYIPRTIAQALGVKK
jgi:hypothetical protein